MLKRSYLPLPGPKFKNPVRIAKYVPTPNPLYVPVLTGSVMTPSTNFYLLNQSDVGTIVLTYKKYLPMLNWALCDGSERPRKGYEMLYDKIHGLFGEDAKDRFVLPRFKYDHEILQDDDVVCIIKCYKRIPGRGGQQDLSVDDSYYFNLGEPFRLTLTRGMTYRVLDDGNILEVEVDEDQITSEILNKLQREGGDTQNGCC